MVKARERKRERENPDDVMTRSQLARQHNELDDGNALRRSEWWTPLRPSS